jgi:hypothetical protein
MSEAKTRERESAIPKATMAGKEVETFQVRTSCNDEARDCHLGGGCLIRLLQQVEQLQLIQYEVYCWQS